MILLVGPEGGITDDEIAALTAGGCGSGAAGPSVLRTSTAAAVALGALGVLTRSGAVGTMGYGRPWSSGDQR